MTRVKIREGASPLRVTEAFAKAVTMLNDDYYAYDAQELRRRLLMAYPDVLGAIPDAPKQDEPVEG